MGHLRTEIMSNSCDPQAWEHGGDEETADVARRKGAAPRRDGLRRGVRRDFGRWGQPAAPRPASPMVEFLKIMAKYGFRLQRGTGDQGGKTQYTHTISIHSYHKSICIGNGMTVASTHVLMQRRRFSFPRCCCALLCCVVVLFSTRSPPHAVLLATGLSLPVAASCVEGGG